MLNQVDWWRTHTGLSFAAPDLQQVMEEFDSAIEQAEQIVEGKMNMSTGSSSSGSTVLSDHLSSKSIVVGSDEALCQLSDRVLGGDRSLQIVSIVGMGGIGKTTLARELYTNSLLDNHFDVRAWTTISHACNIREDLLGLLRCINEQLSDELTECKVEKLAEILYGELDGRIYLIVLDNMWSIHFWDAMKSCFPDNNSRSRIILTTRESDVARCVGRHSFQYEMQLMSPDESWNLLHKIVFGEEDCPDALEEMGRKIASHCKGLPLAINVIGRLLSEAEISKEFWEIIANDVSAAIADNNEFSNILSYSYNHLPKHLKQCVLYMGAFPKDYQIEGSRLIRMWLAEGFVESNGTKSLEEEAKDYLKSLVERNLVLVIQNKPKCYGMHELLKYLCMRKISEEKFVHVKNERVDQVELNEVRRVSALKEMEEDIYAMPFARSFICTDRDLSPEIVSPAFLVLRLLRVLDVLDMQFQEFPMEVLSLVNLRYLAFACSSKSDIPKEISRLLHLQTLIGKIKWGNVAAEIWEMSKLRYLKLQAVFDIKERQRMQENLQTVSWVTCDPSLLRMGFFKTIPNIENLGIYFLEIGDVVDLRHLHKLQKLRCNFDMDGDPWRYLLAIRFPYSLRKLSLQGCLIFGRDLTRTLHALPNLKALKLSRCVFEDEEFDLDEDDVFRSLHYLHLENLRNLVHWRAYNTNFPVLGELVIRECPMLEEIPIQFMEIPTLQRMELCKCNPSLEASARKIQEMQKEEYGNYDLKLEII